MPPLVLHLLQGTELCGARSFSCVSRDLLLCSLSPSINIKLIFHFFLYQVRINRQTHNNTSEINPQDFYGSLLVYDQYDELLGNETRKANRVAFVDRTVHVQSRRRTLKYFGRSSSSLTSSECRSPPRMSLLLYPYRHFGSVDSQYVDFAVYVHTASSLRATIKLARVHYRSQNLRQVY